MIIDWSTVPGYEESRVAERVQRDAAFLDDETILCGIEVQQLTLWHMAALDIAGNPFASGGTVFPWHVMQFLWCVSCEYWSSKSKTMPQSFCAKHGKLDFEQAVAEIRKYIDDANMDSPGGGSASGQSFCSWVATMVHVIASSYGWPEFEILRLPLVRLWQYVRCIRRSNDDKAVFVNPSDKVKGRYLRSLAEESHGA